MSSCFDAASRSTNENLAVGNLLLLSPEERQVEGFRAAPLPKTFQLLRARTLRLALLALLVLTLFLTWTPSGPSNRTFEDWKSVQFVDRLVGVETHAVDGCDRIDRSFVDSAFHSLPDVDRREPVVLIFDDGLLLQSPAVRSGARLCITVVVPQRADEPVRLDAYAPVPDYGPDDIIVELASSAARLILPPLLPLPKRGSRVEDKDEIDAVGVYAAPFNLLDRGTYDVLASIQYRNYDWIAEPAVLEDSVPHFRDERISQRYPSTLQLTTPQRRRRAKQKPCYQTPAILDADAVAGRWISQKVADGIWNPERLHSSHLVDRWGWTYAPDECFLPIPRPIDMLGCLANKTIHVYGDSNLRRVLKVLASAGEYCVDDWAQCQCEDGLANDVFGLDLSPFQSSEIAKKPLYFGAGTQVWFAFIGGLLRTAFIDWKQLMGIRDTSPLDVTEARPPPPWSQADAVIASIGPWDLSWRTANEFAVAVAAFRDALVAAYSDRKIPIIIRLAPSVAYEARFNKRQYTHMRMWRFNNIARRAFQPALDAGHRIYLFDPLMSGRNRREVPLDLPCPNTHSAFPHVRLEAQHMLAMLCHSESVESLSWS